MPSSPDTIVESFPHPTLMPIVGQPTYETLAELHLKLNTNAASIQSHLGNGLLGLLFLTVTPAVYNTQSAIAFTPPANPGPTCVTPVNATAAQIVELRRQHDHAAALYKEYDATDKALKSLLLSAVDETYVRSLRDRFIGYATVTTLQMLTHLYTAYAKISAGDLDDNDAKMKADWDPNQPFEVLIDQIEDSIDMAAAANNPYTPEQVVLIAYNLVFKTGLFDEECKLWRRRPPIDKTWTEFKVVFTLAHQEMRESKQTTRAIGFHSANHAHGSAASSDLQLETAEAIANLATATASDRATVATLTDTNSKLAAEIIALNSKLMKALMQNKTLTSQLSVCGANNSGGSGTNNTGGRRQQLNKGPMYCWSCGSGVWHTGNKCWHKVAGHKADATEENKQGGSTVTFETRN
jgi:hypothetical protein